MEGKLTFHEAEGEDRGGLGILVEEGLGEGGVVGSQVLAVASFGVEAEVTMGFEELIEEVFELGGVPFLFLGGGELGGGVGVAVFGYRFEEGPDQLVGIGFLRLLFFWRFDGGGGRRDAVLEGGPFVEEGGVGLTDEGFEVFFGGLEVFRFEGRGDGLREDFVNFGKVAEEDGL